MAVIKLGGVDSHVHLDQISLIGAVGDKFETGTSSAIADGTTTIISFALQQKTDDRVLPVVEAYHKKVCRDFRGGQVFADKPTVRPPMCRIATTLFP